MKFDIEQVMDKIKSIITDNIQTEISTLNTEHEDYLLPDFDSSAYFLWGLDDIPPYDVSFLQYIVGDPEIIENGPEAAFRYTISLACFLGFETAELNYIRKIRYNRVMYALIQKYLRQRYPSIVVEGFGSTFLQSESGQEVTVSELYFKIDIAY